MSTVQTVCLYIHTDARTSVYVGYVRALRATAETFSPSGLPSTYSFYPCGRWLGSRVDSVLDSGAEGPGFKSQSRRCRVTVLLGKLFTPTAPLFTKQQNW